jgi:hypothetical protein
MDGIPEGDILSGDFCNFTVKYGISWATPTSSIVMYSKIILVIASNSFGCAMSYEGENDVEGKNSVSKLQVLSTEFTNHQKSGHTSE